MREKVFQFFHNKYYKARYMITGIPVDITR